MRTTITLDDDLFAKASTIAGESNASSLITKALTLMIAAESKKRLLTLSGKAPSFDIPSRDSRSTPFSHAAEDSVEYHA